MTSVATITSPVKDNKREANNFSGFARPAPAGKVADHRIGDVHFRRTGVWRADL